MAEPPKSARVELLRIGEAPMAVAANRYLDFVPPDFWELAPELCGGSVNDGYGVVAPVQLQRLRETPFAQENVHPDAVVFSRSSFTRTVYCWAPPGVQLDVGTEPTKVVTHAASFSAWLERAAKGDLAPSGIIRPFWLSRTATAHIHAWHALAEGGRSGAKQRLRSAVEARGHLLVRETAQASWFAMASRKAILSVTMYPEDAANVPDLRVVLRSENEGAGTEIEDLLEQLGWVLQPTRAT